MPGKWGALARARGSDKERASQRLTESGRPHAVLPLTGVTHMTPQEAVAENLPLLQVQFLTKALST